MTEARSSSRDLRNQLSDAEEFKVKAIERGHKIEELQKRLNESETLRIRYLDKLTTLKDQVSRTTNSN